MLTCEKISAKISLFPENALIFEQVSKETIQINSILK